MEWIKKDYDTIEVVEKDGVVWLEHKLLRAFPELKHSYSTRIGGVSTGVCSSMNLRNCQWDTLDNYKKNMQIFCKAAGYDFNKIVATHQTHTTNVEVVREEDIPRGTLFERQYENVDGLVTNVPGAVLVTSYADCIPLYFYDPVNKAIGSSHSGWRGTLGQIGRVTLEKMNLEYGTKPGDVYAAIGPGICSDCYEVSQELYDSFSADYTKDELDIIFKPGREGHYQLDLWQANLFVLLKAGVPREHISVTNICTRCNSELLFSHRAMGNARGNQCGFISI